MKLKSDADPRRIMSMHPSESRIEILSPQLIEQNPLIVREVDELQKRVGLDIGWHYMLDLIWIQKVIKPSHEMRIADAGAGKGILQFMMAERGATIISVDFNRRRFTLPIRMGYDISQLGDSTFEHPYLEHLSRGHLGDVNRLQLLKRQALRAQYAFFRRLRAGLSAPRYWLLKQVGHRNPGTIVLYTCDMVDMAKIGSGSVDAVISLSAIEHMAPGNVRQAYQEFRRIVKPGGRIALTTNASMSEDWYHQPSKAWCFSEMTIRDLFQLGTEVESNWNHYPEIREEIRNSSELRSRLSPRYKLSGQNGMPWGEWKPSYLPVGIMIEKAGE